MKTSIDGVRTVAYAFAEVILDGTEKPFDDAVNSFIRSQEELNVRAPRILGKDPERRALLLFFGHEGLRSGDKISIPDAWHWLLEKHATWTGAGLRFRKVVR